MYSYDVHDFMGYEVCFDSKLIGSDMHLLVGDGYEWVTSPPRDSWHFSGYVKDDSERCFDSLLKLNGVEVDCSPPNNYVTAMSNTALFDTPFYPWQKIMPKRQYREFVEKVVSNVCGVIPRLDKKYYEVTWVPSGHVLRSLQPAHVSLSVFEATLAESDILRSTVEKFKPDKNGFVNPPKYNRFGTRTGRLTIASGPDILRLKKSYRNMLVPFDPTGKVVSIDFSSLEPRILLYEAGRSCRDRDLYSYVSRELFGGEANRDAVKGAIISELYGSGRELLEKTLGIHGDELTSFMGKIRELFMTSQLKKRLKDEFIKTGTIKNRYGRVLQINEPLDHILLNSYAQSTGVDVALLGFSKLVKHFDSMSGVRPMYVLHDALFVDVSSANVAVMESVSKIAVDGYVQEFFLKVDSVV